MGPLTDPKLAVLPKRDILQPYLQEMVAGRASTAVHGDLVPLLHDAARQDHWCSAWHSLQPVRIAGPGATLGPFNG